MRFANSANHRHGGFTMVEVLATLVFLVILLPAIMNGITLSTSVGTSAIRRTVATGLAQSKLTEISQLVANGQTSSGAASGDFEQDGPGYTWQYTIQPWPGDQTSAGIQQIDLVVAWTERGRPESITLSTLAYPRGSD